MITILERTLALLPSDNCVEWLGAKNKYGYGKISNNGKSKIKTGLAHRYIYQLTNGLISDDLVIDHLCRNRACINPKHMQAVSLVENLERGRDFKFKESFGVNPSRPIIPVLKDECKRGHSLTDLTNIEYYANSKNKMVKRCRTCATYRNGTKSKFRMVY